MKKTIIISSIFVLIFLGCSEGPTETSEQFYITRVTGNNGTVSTNHSIRLYVVVTDGNGFPVAHNRVDWEIIQGEGSINEESNFTDSNGKTSIYLTAGKAGEIKVKATVFGSGESVIFTVIAS